MINRVLFDTLAEAGQAVLAYVTQMESEEELFFSANTLAAVEERLLVMAQALSQWPLDVQTQLPDVDWAGWHAVHSRISRGISPRREEIWYAINALVPATLVLADKLRRQHPALFKIDY